MRPIVRNIKNNQFYEYKGNNVFRNLITGIEKEVPIELAKNVFRFNVDATGIINEYPLVADLIKSLNLRHNYELFGLSG